MELFVVLVIALLVFGPKKLPEIGRGVGSAIREFKRHSRDLMSYLDEEPEPRRVYHETTPSLRPAEPLEEDTQEKEEDVREKEDELAPVLPPSPTPSNTHPTL
jgi:sec-independent protein translocase protein TatA